MILEIKILPDKYPVVMKHGKCVGGISGCQYPDSLRVKYHKK